MKLPTPFIRKFLLLPILLGVLFSSCSISRRVPDGMYLLDDVEVEVEGERRSGVQASQLKPYVRQQPNRRIFRYFRFHLGLYNLAKPNKYTGISRWLKTVGEEPVVLDTFLTERSTESLNRYLQSKGFYNVEVYDTTNYHRRKRAKVTYNVIPNQPHRIKRVQYSIEDSLVREQVLADTVNSLLKPGVRFDLDIMNRERRRVEGLLREEGYFTFSRDFISFNADTSVGNRQVDLTLLIRNRSVRTPFGERVTQSYRKYEIGSVYVYPRYDPLKYSQNSGEYLLDTLEYENIRVVYIDNIGVKPDVLARANLLNPGELYSESSVRRTRNSFNSLRLYRMVNVHFEKDEEGSTMDDSPEFNFMATEFGGEGVLPGRLISHIQLFPHTLQSYQVDMVGTTSSQEYGIESTVNYQHRNIFRGAEILDVRFRTELKAIQLSDGGYGNAIEYGGVVGLNIPRYLNPIAGQGFVNKYNPRTTLTTQYNYQDRPDYTRTVAGMSFGYIWRNEGFVTHSIIPAEVSLINIYSIDPGFTERIEGTYRENSYVNQFITTTGYGLVFNNQNLQRKTSYTHLRINTEVSGNLLSLLHPLVAEKDEDGTRKIFGTSFSQFVRGDVNYVYNQVIDPVNTLVYRVFLGAGLPYGNSSALPFEKQFFSGGSGLRAWQARSLGPGSYVEDRTEMPNYVPNQSADIKFEANFEYRFELFWMLEGAFFLDAGNIWAITTEDERPGASFEPDSFYKQIALGSGVGVRVNLGFFIFRYDLGVKVYDPGVRLFDDNGDNKSKHWVPFQRSYESSDFEHHFGIGYPF